MLLYGAKSENVAIFQRGKYSTSQLSGTAVSLLQRFLRRYAALESQDR